MLDTDKVTVEDRALIGWYKLPAPLQAKIMETLGNLAGQPVESWPNGEIERWWENDDLYALHVWVDLGELLIFFRPGEGRIRIDSMTLKETIDRYSVKKA